MKAHRKISLKLMFVFCVYLHKSANLVANPDRTHARFCFCALSISVAACNVKQSVHLFIVVILTNLHRKIRRDFERIGVSLLPIFRGMKAAQRCDHCAIVATEFKVEVLDGQGEPVG